MFYLELVQNVGLLVSLVVIHGQIIRRWNRRTLTSQIFSGFLFGCVALIGMMAPVHLVPGVIFDGRSIVLSVAGLFGGPVTAGMAAIISAAFRLWLGGPGVIMGIGSILESAGLGVAFYYLRPLYPGLTRNLYLFGFGLLVHLGVLLLTLALPREAMLETLEHMAIPLLLIFPAATWLICLLFLDQESHIAVEEALRESEERHRSVIEHLPQRIFIKDLNSVYLSCNGNYASDRGVTPEQMIGKDDFAFHPPELAEAYRKDDQAVLATGMIKDFEETYQLHGQEQWAHTVKMPYRDRRGQVIGLLGIYEDITERKQAEEALRQSETKLRLIAETNEDVFWMCNPDTTEMIYLSPSYEKLWGRTCQSAYDSPKSFIEAIHPEDRERVTAILEEHINELSELEYRIVKPDGTVRWIHDRAFPVRNANGNLELMTGVARDITDSKLAKEALRSSEERFRNLFETANDGIFLSDGSTFIECNAKALQIFGCLEKKDIVGHTPKEFSPDRQPDGSNSTEKSLEYVVAALDSDPQTFYWKHCRKDGSTFDAEVSINALTLKGKTYLQGMVRDISERKRMQDLLEQSEEKYQKLFQDAPLMYVITRNEQGIPFISNCNKLFLSSVGFALEDVVGKPLTDFFSPESRTRLLEGDGYARALAGEYVMGERELLTQDCSIIQTLLYTMPETDYSGNITGTRAMFVDITAQRKAEETQRRLTTTIEQAAEGVVITDPKGTIQYVNPAEENISGYTRDELIGHGADIFKSDKHTEDFYSNMWATINSGKVWSGRFVNKKKDGTEYHEDATISPIYDHSGNLTNFVVVQHDVTQQVALQEQLFQAQKMEAIGTLAGGFAHDFNNKLQVIDGYVDLMLFDKDLPDTWKQDMRIIKQAVDSSAELIKGMMVFSRKTPIELQPIDLNKLVAQTGSMLARSISKIIEIVLLLADDLWAITAAPNQIDQILMNLAVNARDAMPDGGRLTLETKNIVLDQEYCSFDPLVKPGRYVLIEVSDTGAGMDKETASHIFEPFFTTKGEGKGTGLGLAVVYGIVEQHGARIICDSAPSVGTTFRIYFPAIEKVHEEEYFENKEPPRGEGETILLVDDEPHLRDIVARQLVGANYRVIKASNGNEALNLYEEHREQISLIILDLLMPELNGRQCLEDLLVMDPNVRVLIASGAMNSAIEADLKEIGARGLIAKPFETSQLLEEIRKIIDED